jgi:carbon-monoxide dehydrogenase medium subunit
MQNFEYFQPQTLDEAVVALARENGRARILAGGTDLLVQMREGRRTAGLLVDVKRIPELFALHYDPGGGLSIGAAASCLRVVDFCRSLAIYPGLTAAVELIGGTQIQGRASVGGNLCNASPAADAIPALIVHRAVCVVRGPAGERRVAVEDFCTAPGQTVLQPGELLVSIELPPAPRGFGAHYLRFTPRNEMDIAVAGAAAGVTLSADGGTYAAVRLALGAVAPRPLFLREAGEQLAGRPVGAETIEEAARLARAAASPVDDTRGTGAQRRHLSGVLIRRALQAAEARARKEL